MTQSITIRPTTEDDWRVLKDIRLAALHDSPQAFGASYAAASTFDEAEWRKRAHPDSRLSYWLALSGQQAVGMIGSVPVSESECHLIAMWVRPEFRQHGLAGRLVDIVKASARERGCLRMLLSVVPENTSAVRLYRRHGFVFLDEWEPLDSHPHIKAQKMSCQLESFTR